MLLSAILLSPLLSLADGIHVRFEEGLSRGFLTLSTENGQKIADGESTQVLKGEEVVSRLTIRFKDGSRYDDRTVFSQRAVFHVITDHLIEKGPSFKTPIETLIDTSKGEVNVRYQDSHGKQKFLSKRMELPADVANGLLFTLVKDIDPDATETTVAYVAAAPKPRLVHLVFKPQGEDAFTTDGAKQKARHYVMSVEIGGVAGALAPLVGKKMHDTDIWVIDGDAPTFAGWRGPFYENGPIWQISLVSPVFSKSGRSTGERKRDP